MLKEKCGIFGIYSSSDDVSYTIRDGLFSLQHRGQESAGISVLRGGKIYSQKCPGEVVGLTDELLSKLSGTVGIGHVRYSTAGEKSLKNAQPMDRSTSKFNISLAFNGNIPYHEKLKEELLRHGYIFQTDSDTEVILTLYLRERAENDVWDACKNLMEDLPGSYSTLIMSDYEKLHLLAYRDPFGVKPLCVGKRDDDYLISSETIALEQTDAKFVKEVEPGEAVLISEDGFESKKLVKSNRHAHCAFEFDYFSHPGSEWEGKQIYSVRKRLGELLYELYPIDADVVIPVPDSGRSGAIGYSRRSGIPYEDGLIKNKFVGRTFIMPHQKKRENAVKHKLIPVKSVIKDKDVVVVDDSIVRGTTSKRVTNILKRWAKKVHLLSTFPKVTEPCYLGIDFPTQRELIASNKDIDEITKEIGADTVGYMTIEGLIDGIGLPENDLCLACLNKNCPIRLP
ncbi:MAG: amidophosphoribosyltransferase [Candidatus Aenigmarchaeota archaeon]|nr:amidophosphoribosyltransferase [Candidatus Aenigmarchaeota archaeon]